MPSISFVDLLFGHLVGDYLLQNNWMALSKNRNAWRNTVHCIIYTLSIMLFCRTADWRFVTLVFVSHWIPDYFSIGGIWLKLIRGRSMVEFMHTVDDSQKNILTGAFTSIVYVVVDNTIHLLAMWYGWRFIQ